MRNTVIWSFLSMVALASGGLMAGCDSDEKLARSALGESCAKTSDCDDGLRCLDGTCYKPATGTAGSSNGAGGDGAEPVGPKPPVLGGEGESCGRAADCEDGLGCFSGRCSKAEAGGEGGEGNTGGGVKLGGKGETCGLTSDCQKGLACLPSDGVIFPDALAIGSNSVGVCTPTDNGLEPTGNVCGAECKEAADCCELPVAVHLPWAAANTPGVSGPYGTGVNSCAQLAAKLADVKCATTKVAAELAMCFAQSAYCDCGKTTWTCSEAGTCVYTAACTANTVGSVPGGCPTFTRTGATTPTTTCSKAKKCEPVASGCAEDKDCDETVPVFDQQTDTCSDGKCVCHTDTGRCYRGCQEDLDCPAHYACDTKTSLCTANAECETDASCVTRYNDITKKCIEGTCQSSCDNDLECNGGRLTQGTDTRVCNAKHECEIVGCQSDDECTPAGGVRTFCAKAVTGAGTAAVTSAVTD
jgi:hypothetical protein